jgi:nucleotide-binding universal stress UspA family protein
VVDHLDLEVRKEERAYLDRLTARLTKLGPVQVTPALLDGEDVAQTVYARAAAGADLVVMSTHGRGPFQRFWLGSVADDLVRRLPVPVLLVRPKPAAPDFTGEPALKHFVIPLDDTPLAEQVLEPALDVGGLMGASYTLLRVIRPAVRVNYLPEGSTLTGMMSSLLEQIQAAQKEMEKEANSYLDGVVAKVRSSGLTVRTRVAVDEQPAVGVLRQAEELSASAIALATHGRRGLSRMVLGSVADKVVRGTNVPVLLYRPRHP